MRNLTFNKVISERRDSCNVRSDESVIPDNQVSEHQSPHRMCDHSESEMTQSSNHTTRNCSNFYDFFVSFYFYL